MRIALNVYPLKSAHKDRGIGYYTKNLLEQLRKDNSIEVVEFTNLSEVKEADVIHYPWFDLYFHTLPIRKKFPTVVTIHDVMPLVFKDHYPVGLKGKINFHLQKMALSGCSQFITDSQVSKNDISKYLNIHTDKITVIHLAAENDFKPLSQTKLIYLKRRYNLPDNFLLYVGNANWAKNLPFLIRGFNSVNKLPGFEDTKLVLAGGVFLKNVENINHPELESLKMTNRLIREFKLEEKIIRPGNLSTEELVSFYNLATLYIQPSLYEGFGLPILEAFACGTPVVSSNRGSLPEVGGNAVLYFNPTNLDQFVAVVLEVLKDRSLQNKLTEMGFKRADRFTWEKLAEQTKKVYLRAANK